MNLGGREVHIEPSQVIFEDGAFEQVGAIVSNRFPRGTCAILMDQRTGEVAGHEITELLSRLGLRTREIIVPDRSNGRSPVCDKPTFEQVLQMIGKVDTIVSVGSGVINDLSKWSAYTMEKTYFSVATAASMNGYTSANVAASINGVKVLERSRPPGVVASTPKLIAEAPYELTASGLGDIVAKTASSTDWYLNHILFGDEFIQESVDLTADIEPYYMEHSERLKTRDRDAIEALFHGLMLTGVAMTMAGSSAPASGGEHLVSHALDMMSTLRGREHDLHGRQVGVGTILALELYRRLLALESPTWRADRAMVSDFSFWNELATPVSEIYDPKRDRIARAVEWLDTNKWDDLRDSLSKMLKPPEELKRCLATAGGAHRAEDLGCTKEYLLEALLHCHEMRARFTVMDMAWMSGIMPGCAEEIIETFA